jgi:RNA polymerase sigma-70 factor (family 1)
MKRPSGKSLTHTANAFGLTLITLHNLKLMADEVVQEVFLKLWLNRKSLAQVNNFNAWLHTIARNNVFDTVKKAAREAQMLKNIGAIRPSASNNVDTFVFDKENEALLHQALEQLSPQQRQVFNLSRNQGMKYDEIAIELNISRNTVKTHLSNALHTIREHLNIKSDGVLLLCIIFGCK